VLLGKASGLFGSGAKLNIPVLVLVVAALMVLFVHPWIRQEQDNKAQSALTSKQVTVSAVVVIGLALAVKMAVDAFWGKVPEYRFLLMGSGAMVVLFLLPLARERRK
jgi:quinol-cytochrome oxidoreductase complex cytochrome b subunit